MCHRSGVQPLLRSSNCQIDYWKQAHRQRARYSMQYCKFHFRRKLTRTYHGTRWGRKVAERTKGVAPLRLIGKR